MLQLDIKQHLEISVKIIIIKITLTYKIAIIANKTDSSTKGYSMESYTIVLGASPKENRYSNKAVALLHSKNIPVIPIHPTAKKINDIPCLSSLSEITVPIDTITLYINEKRSTMLLEEIINCAPRRIIMNPGTENPLLEEAAKKAGITVQHACTLVLLNTNQWAL